MEKYYFKYLQMMVLNIQYLAKVYRHFSFHWITDSASVPSDILKHFQSKLICNVYATQDFAFLACCL